MRRAATPRGYGKGSMGGGGGGGGGGGRIPWRSPEGRRCVRLPARSQPFGAGEFAALGLTPSASKSDVKRAYKRLALKYHPDVIIRGDNGVQEKDDTFREIKSAYESLMAKFEEEDSSAVDGYGDEWEEWDEWMGTEGGLPVVYNLSS